MPSAASSLKNTPGYADASVAAVESIKAGDKGFYRVEKTFNSVSLCDALAQDYMGVKSYWFQGAGPVGFYSALDLLPQQSAVKNFTNWLPTFGGRFVLNSLVGVKYIITRTPVDWPGFRKIRDVGAVTILQNDLALPLGVVYQKQLPRETFAGLTLEAKDIALMNAVVVERLRGDRPRVFDIAQFKRPSQDWLADNYMAPARQLQGRGMTVEHFSHGRISGKISSDVAGIVVFSIPFTKGWLLEVDGVEQPLFKANLGMLAADISAGEHRIELRYSLPGLVPGILAGLLGVIGILALAALSRRSAGRP
jgi:uncharacterized membrane protein YfhO